jgi:hypothetical protein
MYGVLVHRHGVPIPTDADVDMPGHVHDMPGTRHQLRQAIRAVLSALREGRFDGVDVVVTRTGVVRIDVECAYERTEDLVRAGVWSAVRVVPRPVVPGAQVHQGRGVEREYVIVVRESPGDVRHRVRVGGITSRPVGLGIRAVPARQRVDERLFDVRHLGGVCLCLRDCLVRGGPAGGVHRPVDVRAVRERDAPPAHRAVFVLR